MEREVLRGSRPVLHPPSHCSGKDVSRCGWGGGGGSGRAGGEVEVLRGSQPVLHPPSHCSDKDVSR